MKKILAFALVLIMSLALFFFPAGEAKAESNAVVRFVNPQEIAVFEENLYVLDNIGNGTTVIQRFNLEGTELKTFTAEGNFFDFYIIDVEVEVTPQEEEGESEAAVELQRRVYFLGEEGIFYARLAEESDLPLTKCIGENAQFTFKRGGFALYQHKKDIFAFYLVSREGRDYLYRVDTANADAFLTYEITAGSAKDLLMQEGDVYVATTEKILKYEINSSNSLLPAQTYKEEGGEIIVAEEWQRVNNVERDVKSVGAEGVNIPCVKIASYFNAYEEEKLYYFALAEDNKIYKYFTAFATQPKNRNYTKIEAFFLGTDTVIASAPQEQDITGWKIVSCGGYPSDYIYMFKASQNGQIDTKSVPQGVNLSDGEVLIKLEANLPTDRYDYVYYKGKYGFVEKGALKDITDDYNYSATGRVVSNDFIYSLPHKEGGYFSVERNTALTIEKFLQLWEEKWYYVTFEKEGKTLSGWIRQSGVTGLSGGGGANAVGIYKINPPVGKQVAVYKENLGGQALVIEGEAVFLGLSERVTLLQKGEKYSKIQFSLGGTQYIGYVKTQYLIEKGLTTTGLLGIALLTVVAAAALFLIIMAKRKKAHDKAKNEREEL